MPGAGANPFSANPFGTPWGTVGTILGGAGVLNSFFGGGGDNGYAAARGTANMYGDKVADIGDNWNNLGNREFGYLQGDQSKQRDLTGQLVNYLSTDPRTNDYFARNMSNALGNAQANYAKAGNDAANRLNVTGQWTGNSGNAGLSAGINAYLQGRSIADTSGAQQQTGWNLYNLMPQRLQQAAAAEGGLTGQDFSMGSTGYQNAQNADLSQQSYWNGQAMQDRSLDQQNAMMANQGLGGFGQQLAYGPAMNHAYQTIADALNGRVGGPSPVPVAGGTGGPVVAGGGAPVMDPTMAWIIAQMNGGTPWAAPGY